MKLRTRIIACAVAGALAGACMPAAAFAAQTLALPSLARSADSGTGTDTDTVPIPVPALETPATPKGLKLAGGTECVTATWRAVEGATGYAVRYATAKNMKGAKLKVTIGGNTTKVKLKGLKGLATYYVQVRALAKGTGELEGQSTQSGWSAKKQVRTNIMNRSYKQLLTALSEVSGKSGACTFGTSYKLQKTKAGKRLIKQLKSIARRYNLAVDCIDIKTGQGFSFNGKKKIYSASSLKGPYTMAVNKYCEKAAKSTRGTQRATCTWSSNDDYAALRSRYGSECMRTWMRNAKVSSWPAASRYTTVPANDLAKLWVEGYWYLRKDMNSNSKWCRSILNHGTNAFIYRANKGKHTVYTKAGWYPGSARGSITARNDAGIVMAGSHPYVLCIMSTAYNSPGELTKLARLCDAVHADMVKGL